MVIYAVHINVHPDVAAEYRAWLDDHIAQMLALPGFVRAELFQREDDGPEAMTKWTTFYYLESREALERYFRDYAAAMRGDGTNRFGGKFEISRQIFVSV